MDYLAFRSKTTVPPGGWQYIDPDTGLTYGYKDSVSGRKNVNTIGDIVEAMAQDRSVRDLPMLPEQPEKLIEHFNCEKLDDATKRKLCYNAPPQQNKPSVAATRPRTVTTQNRFDLRTLYNGMQVFTTWLAAGMPLVSREEAVRRAEICSQCPMQAKVPGCRTCSRMARTVMRLQPKARTPFDAKLENCMVCKCVNKAQVWAPEKYLSIGVTDAMMEQFPNTCWKKQLLTQEKDNNETSND